MIGFIRAFLRHRREHGVSSAIHASMKYGPKILLNRLYLRPLQQLPRLIGVGIFLVTHWIIPNFDPVVFQRDGELFVLKNIATGELLHFPNFPRVADLKHVSEGYIEKNGQKYIHPDVVEPESGDTVVDVGAYVGAFSLSASANTGANDVVAFEPTPRTFEALERNVAETNVTPYNYCIFTENKSVELSIGSDPTDNSLIDIDDEKEVGTETIPGVRLDEFLHERGIEVIDYLKIDAEGAEPEVLASATNIDIQKVAVDCGPERYGESTTEEVRTLLEDWEFDVYQKGNLLFGIKS